MKRTILQPHEQRVVAELDELRERLTKLEGFMASDTFVNLPPEDRELLVLQKHLMASLGFVLARRIGRFTRGGGEDAAVRAWMGGASIEEAKALPTTCPHGVPHRWPCEQCGAAGVKGLGDGQ